MVKRRGHHFLLIAGFLTAIYAVGFAQGVIELRRGEPPQVLDLFRRTPSVANLRSFENDLEAASWFARTWRPQMQYLRYLALQDAGEKALIGRNGWWFYKPGVRYLIEPTTTNAKEHTGHDAAVATIVAFRDQLAARGIRLLVVPVPGKASVYPEMLTTRAAKAGPSVHTHTRRVIADLSKAGIEVVDLFAAFARARANRSQATQLYLTRDTHWAPSGVRLAAETVAQKIRDLGWAATGPPVYDVKPVRIERRGDVLRMIQTPQIDRLFAPEVVRCRQIVRRDTGQPYRDNSDAPILVLGDSFLRIYEHDEPGSAGFIAYLAHELQQPLASVVNDGGASTLVRQALARKPSLLVNKTLVIWEFVERDIRFGLEGWQHVPLPDPVQNETM